MNEDANKLPSPAGRRAGDEGAAQPHGQFLVYQTDDGQIQIDVRLQGETAWLTQAHMAELFQTTVPNVSMHLRNIYAEGELQPAATVQEFLTVRPEARGPDHFAGVNKMVGGAFQSQRDCVTQPRVARNELPWVERKMNFQPQRGCIVFAPVGWNPFRVGEVCCTVSQGSSCLATLGWRMESRWDSRTGARQARALKQTIVGNVAEILEA